MCCGDCDAAIAEAAAAVTHVQSQSQEVGSGDEGLGLLYFDLSSAETDGGWRTSSRNLTYFRVSCDILRSSRKRSIPCVPTTVVVLKQPSQSIHTSREAKTFRRRFHLPYVAPRSSPPCWRTAKWYHQILQKVQNLMPHDDCIPSCTVYTIVQQYALVDYYCCFHLTSGSSTAVGPSIVHRNRKRFFLSQSTLREEFVEKKYQVFDIIGLLTILVQVNLSSPVERV